MENILKYNEPANGFVEALPIGNGSFGAMVYSGGVVDKIALSHDKLWSGTPGVYHKEGAYEAFCEAQKKALAGKVVEADKIIESRFTGEDSQAFMPMGSLYIKSNKGSVTDYERMLDMENAIVSAKYMVSGKSVSKECFASFPDDCIMYRCTSSEKMSYEVYFDSPLKINTELNGNSLIIDGECPYKKPKGTDAKDSLYNGDGIKFTTVIKCKTDSEIILKDGKIIIENTADFTLYICTFTSFVAFDEKPDAECHNVCVDKANRLFQKEYADIKREHIDDFSKYYNRVKLHLDGEHSQMFTDERLKREDKDNGFFELIFNYARYLTISGSRSGSEALNLQGIWNESITPPWSSGYTTNINLEMCYWPTLVCNLAEFNEPIIEQLKKISKAGVDTAHYYYHADGFCAHHNSDIWGHTVAVGNGNRLSSGYGFWNLCGGWLCRHAFEHYEYTNDVEYLRNTAYPIMKEAARFYLSIIVEDEGKQILCPSTSPENIYISDDVIGAIDDKSGWPSTWHSVAKWTTMSQTILIELFRNIIKATEILGVDSEFSDKLKMILPKLDTFKIGSKGQLLEWDKEYEEMEQDHRHVSHLYGLYPGEVFSAETTPDITQACRRSLELRGDTGTGWSLVWKAALWAKLKDAEHSLLLLNKQLEFTEELGFDTHKGGTYRNLFDAHPPFQIDGNFGCAACIALMLLQCEDNRIKLLPALPEKFSCGSVSGLIAKGGIEISMKWKHSEVTEFSLVSPINCSINVEVNGELRRISLDSNEKKTYIVGKL